MWTWILGVGRLCRSICRMPRDLDTLTRALVLHSQLQQETNSLLRETIMLLTQQPAITPVAAPSLHSSLASALGDPLPLAQEPTPPRNPHRLRTDRDVTFGPPHRIPTVQS